jgi:hypothetical protein
VPYFQAFAGMDSQPPTSPSFWRRRPLYPNHYVWFIFLSTLDVLLTWLILAASGVEANPIAAAVIDRFGFHGMIVYKFLLMVVVIFLCERIGRRNDRAGRLVIDVGVGITSFPIVLSFAMLYRFYYV